MKYRIKSYTDYKGDTWHVPEYRNGWLWTWNTSNVQYGDREDALSIIEYWKKEHKKQNHKNVYTYETIE